MYSSIGLGGADERQRAKGTSVLPLLISMEEAGSNMLRTGALSFMMMAVARRHIFQSEFTVLVVPCLGSCPRSQMSSSLLAHPAKQSHV